MVVTALALVVCSMPELVLVLVLHAPSHGGSSRSCMEQVAAAAVPPPALGGSRFSGGRDRAVAM